MFPTHQAQPQRYKITVQLLKKSSSFSCYSIHSFSSKIFTALRRKGISVQFVFLTTTDHLKGCSSLNARNEYSLYMNYILHSLHASTTPQPCPTEVNVKTLFALSFIRGPACLLTKSYSISGSKNQDANQWAEI